MTDQSKPPKATILLQLDTDLQPSVFDAVVAIDAGVQHLLQHGGVAPQMMRDLVHGLLFTRGIDDLRRSAVFVGGSDVEAGEALLRELLATFFGPFRVSALLDSRGANTTAAATVLAVEQGLGGAPNWFTIKALVLGAGPVGRRVGRLLAKQGAQIRIGTPDVDQRIEGVELFEMKPDWPLQFKDATVIVAAGPAGVEILPTLDRQQFPELAVAVDLNAVPPHGLGGTKPTDANKERVGVRVWGALGVGGLKMKIHKAAVRALYQGEATVFDLEQVFEVARQLQFQNP